MYVSGGGTLQNRKGFTLIELLAVIVILAIIALIAAPIVLNIIKDTKDSASLRSAEFYLDAVEMAIAKSRLDGIVIRSGTYNAKIMKNGDVCLEQYNSDIDSCPKDKKLEVEINGDVPTNGTITIKSKKIYTADFFVSNKQIRKEISGKLAFVTDDINKIPFDGIITVKYYEDDKYKYYYLEDCLDKTKFKNGANYKVTFDSTTHDVISSVGNDGLVLSKFTKNATFEYLQVKEENDLICSIFIKGVDNLSGDHHLKIEYVDNAYPHLIKVYNNIIEIYSTELLEGTINVKIETNDGIVFPINNVEVTESHLKYASIRIDSDSYNSVVGKEFTMTITQNNKEYKFDSSSFKYISSDGCSSNYYYSGNYDLQFWGGC